MKRFLSALIFLVMMLSFSIAEEEDHEILYVTASRLNGRYAPSKKSTVEALFDYGTEVEATGNWSKDMKWVEVYGGESGTVWCRHEYLSSILEPIVVTNDVVGKVKIRSKPGTDSRVVGYVKTGKDIVVTQIVCGWGKTNKGWINMSYFKYKID